MVRTALRVPELLGELLQGLVVDAPRQQAWGKLGSDALTEFHALGCVGITLGEAQSPQACFVRRRRPWPLPLAPRRTLALSCFLLDKARGAGRGRGRFSTKKKSAARALFVLPQKIVLFAVGTEGTPASLLLFPLALPTPHLPWCLLVLASFSFLIVVLLVFAGRATSNIHLNRLLSLPVKRRRNAIKRQKKAREPDRQDSPDTTLSARELALSPARALGFSSKEPSLGTAMMATTSASLCSDQYSSLSTLDTSLDQGWVGPGRARREWCGRGALALAPPSFPAPPGCLTRPVCPRIALGEAFREQG